MEQDSGLNSKIEFIAMDATFEQLNEMGYYNEVTLALDGILLKIRKVEMRWNNRIFLKDQDIVQE